MNDLRISIGYCIYMYDSFMFYAITSDEITDRIGRKGMNVIDIIQTSDIIQEKIKDELEERFYVGLICDINNKYTWWLTQN